MKAYAVLIDGKLQPEEGATEVRVFSREKYATVHANLLRSYDFMKGKEITIKLIDIK